MKRHIAILMVMIQVLNIASCADEIEKEKKRKVVQIGNDNVRDILS